MYYSYTNLILKMVPLYNKFVYVNIGYEITTNTIYKQVNVHYYIYVCNISSYIVGSNKQIKY